MLEDKHDIAIAFAARLRDLQQQLETTAAAIHSKSIHQEVTLLTRRIRDLGYTYDPRLAQLTEPDALDHEEMASPEPHFDDLLFA